MKKTKIYLDTSVISHLDQKDAPDKMYDTLRLWDRIISGEYEVFLSAITLEETFECSEPKLTSMKERLALINYRFIELDDEIRELAQKVIETGILKPKSIDDCYHIACVVVNECGYLLSWNFKHLVNVKKINGVRAITSLTGYHQIDIVTPTILIEGDYDD